MIVLNIKVEDSSPLASMKRELAKIKREVMGEVGNEFVRSHLLPHFGPQNRARFAHDRRNRVYASKIKTKKGQGAGRFVDDVLSGASKRQAQATVRVTKTQDRATVRCSLPAYFVKPFIGTFVKEERGKDGTVRRVPKRVTRQPDKVKELTTVDQKDRQELAEYGAKVGEKLWKQRQATKTKKITG